MNISTMLSVKLIFINIFLVGTVMSSIISGSSKSNNNNEIVNNDWKERLSFKFRNGKTHLKSKSVSFYVHSNFGGQSHTYQNHGNHGNCIATNGNDLYSSVRQVGCVKVYVDHLCRGRGKTICGNHEEFKHEFMDRISSFHHV